MQIWLLAVIAWLLASVLAVSTQSGAITAVAFLLFLLVLRIPIQRAIAHFAEKGRRA